MSLQYIYLLQEQYAIYKIDKSVIGGKNSHTYTTGSVVLFQMICIDCKKIENLCIKQFKSLYKQLHDKGNNYFTGDYLDMIYTIVSIVKTEKHSSKHELIIAPSDGHIYELHIHDACLEFDAVKFTFMQHGVRKNTHSKPLIIYKEPHAIDTSIVNTKLSSIIDPKVKYDYQIIYNTLRAEYHGTYTIEDGGSLLLTNWVKNLFNVLYGNCDFIIYKERYDKEKKIIDTYPKNKCIVILHKGQGVVIDKQIDRFNSDGYHNIIVHADDIYKKHQISYETFTNTNELFISFLKWGCTK